MPVNPEEADAPLVLTPQKAMCGTNRGAARWVARAVLIVLLLLAVALASALFYVRPIFTHVAELLDLPGCDLGLDHPSGKQSAHPTRRALQHTNAYAEPQVDEWARFNPPMSEMVRGEVVAWPRPRRSALPPVDCADVCDFWTRLRATTNATVEEMLVGAAERRSALLSDGFTPSLELAGRLQMRHLLGMWAAGGVHGAQRGGGAEDGSAGSGAAGLPEWMIERAITISRTSLTCGSTGEMHGFVWKALSLHGGPTTATFWKAATHLCGRLPGVDFSCALMECYHGVGHAAFVRAARSLGMLAGYSALACPIIRFFSIPFSEELIAAAEAICSAGPDSSLEVNICFSGVYHSVAQFVTWGSDAPDARVDWREPCARAAQPALCLFNIGKYHLTAMHFGNRPSEHNLAGEAPFAREAWDCPNGTSDFALGCIAATSFNLFTPYEIFRRGDRFSPPESCNSARWTPVGPFKDGYCVGVCHGSIAGITWFDPYMRGAWSGSEPGGTTLSSWCHRFVRPARLPLGEADERRLLACVEGWGENGVAVIMAGRVGFAIFPQPGVSTPRRQLLLKLYAWRYCLQLNRPPFSSKRAFDLCRRQFWHHHLNTVARPGTRTKKNDYETRCKLQKGPGLYPRCEAEEAGFDAGDPWWLPILRAAIAMPWQ